MISPLLEDKYIQQVNKLNSALKQATENEDITLISKYDVLIAALLKSLQGKQRTTALNAALEKLKMQHQRSSLRVNEMLDEVKGKLSQFKKKKKRMVAYAPAATAHIKINA